MALPLRAQIRLVEAVCALGFAHFLCAFIPFRIWAGWHGDTDKGLNADSRALRHGENIAWAIGKAVHVLPLKSRCLPNAVAARSMLSRRGVRSHLHIAVRPDRLSPADVPEFHAWLTIGPQVVVGGEDLEGYKAFEEL